jgi:hypothetical protein
MYHCLSFMVSPVTFCIPLTHASASCQFPRHGVSKSLSAGRMQSSYIVSVLRLVQFNMVNYYQSVRLHVAGVRA